MNLHQKLNAIMADVTYIYKDGQISFGNTKYRAVTEEQVLSIIRPHLVKHHIVIYPVSLDMSREGQITSAVMSFKVVNADDPDDFIIVYSAGQGSDTQDKGAGKSITYAEKYCILKLLLVPTGLDPDKTSSAELDAMQEAQQTNRAVLNSQILTIGGGDLERVNVFIRRVLKRDDADLDTITDDEAKRVKVALAKAVGNGT